MDFLMLATVALSYKYANIFCKLFKFILITSSAKSIMTLSQIALDRYFNFFKHFSPFYRNYNNHKTKISTIIQVSI